MKLKKVISGGQSGADKTALEQARDLGLITGGTAPKGWRTEGGKDSSLESYGLVESWSESYPPRTKQNVKDADITLWFGNIGSPGYWCTWNAAKTYNKPFVANPTPTQMVELANLHETWNVAGNRCSTNPNVVRLVMTAFDAIKPLEKTE